MSITAKSGRIDLRISEDLKAEIAEAAELSGVTTTSFIQSAAVRAARDVMEQSHRITLDDTAWDLFAEALTGPTTPNEGLRDLLSRPSVFEG